jgi:hypothetical protein
MCEAEQRRVEKLAEEWDIYGVGASIFLGSEGTAVGVQGRFCEARHQTHQRVASLPGPPAGWVSLETPRTTRGLALV